MTFFEIMIAEHSEGQTKAMRVNLPNSADELIERYQRAHQKTSGKLLSKEKLIFRAIAIAAHSMNEEIEEMKQAIIAEL